jgi:TRAP transporter TAXI family solute receptor
MFSTLLKTFRFYLVFLLVFSLGLAALWLYQDSHKHHEIRIAASKPGSDSYKLLQAAANLAMEQFPNMHIEMLASLGSSQNLELLKANQVQFAAIQADSDIIPEARLVAQLYPDMFHLIAREDSGIKQFSDLHGKHLALASTSSGQYKTFWFLAKHYNFTEADFAFKSMSASAANFALEQGAVDAVFRVRPPGSDSIKKLVAKLDVKIIPLDQGHAMSLEQPVLENALIPKGAYLGKPPFPKEDLPTASVQRLLLARYDLDDEAVRMFTQILFEQRKELLKKSKLSSFIQAPKRNQGTQIPMHDGAVQYYDRNEPSFLQNNAEPIALILTVMAALFSGIMQLARRRQKTLVQAYNQELTDILLEAEQLNDQDRLQVMADHLNDILKKVVKDRSEDNLSAEDFDFISFTWQMTRDEVNERLLPQEVDHRVGAGHDSMQGAGT